MSNKRLLMLGVLLVFISAAISLLLVISIQNRDSYNAAATAIQDRQDSILLTALATTVR